MVVFLFIIINEFVKYCIVNPSIENNDKNNKTIKIKGTLPLFIHAKFCVEKSLSNILFVLTPTKNKINSATNKNNKKNNAELKMI